MKWILRFLYYSNCLRNSLTILFTGASYTKYHGLDGETDIIWGIVALAWGIYTIFFLPRIARKIWGKRQGYQIISRLYYLALCFAVPLIFGGTIASHVKGNDSDYQSIVQFLVFHWVVLGIAVPIYYYRKEPKVDVPPIDAQHQTEIANIQALISTSTEPPGDNIAKPVGAIPPSIDVPAAQDLAPAIAAAPAGKAVQEPKKRPSAVLSINVVHYHAPTEDGQLPLQGHDQPFWDDFLRLRFNSTETQAELTLSYDHSSLSVRPYDIVVAKDGPLRHFMTCEGEGSHLTQARPGRMRLSATGDAWMVEEKIHIQLS